MKGTFRKKTQLLIRLVGITFHLIASMDIIIMNEFYELYGSAYVSGEIVSMTNLPQIILIHRFCLPLKTAEYQLRYTKFAGL